MHLYNLNCCLCVSATDRSIAQCCFGRWWWGGAVALKKCMNERCCCRCLCTIPYCARDRGRDIGKSFVMWKIYKKPGIDAEMVHVELRWRWLEFRSHKALHSIATFLLSKGVVSTMSAFREPTFLPLYMSGISTSSSTRMPASIRDTARHRW